MFTATAGSSPSYSVYTTCSTADSDGKITCSATDQGSHGDPCNCPENTQTFIEDECNYGDASTKLVDADDEKVDSCISTAADVLGARHCLQYQGAFNVTNRTVLNASNVPQLKKNKTATHSAAHRSAASGLLVLFAVSSWLLGA
eukprot:gnl/TRDRNA2_/TRDRNA2_85860_c1_seq1.p1 gnl/TRDRNA2_/TRDRNA2_85860_c1~~gnl/TRDRNA2_/TRDRNA2_85860_c1_seq1.p1  ORF type:complete len:144 (+),score=20.21 gnl/TRDRNA2_/TRDRNA2_85860_c1_seq1:71-502(+)